MLFSDLKQSDEVLETRRRYEERREGLGAEFATAVDAIVERIVTSPLAFPCAHAKPGRRVAAFPICHILSRSGGWRDCSSGAPWAPASVTLANAFIGAGTSDPFGLPIKRERLGHSRHEDQRPQESNDPETSTMEESPRDPETFARLDELVETITACRSQHEQLCGFRQALADHLLVPCDAFVIGEPVSLIGFDYDGNVRRGLSARCRRADGAEYEVAAADVILSSRTSGGCYLAAYRRWLGLAVASSDTPTRRRPLRQHKVASTDINLDSPIELLVLSVKDVAARCRLLGSDRAITLRATRLWDVVPGEIVRVRPRKHWRYAGHPYLSGEFGTHGKSAGASRANPSTTGPDRSSPVVLVRSSKWSRSCPVWIRTISTRIRSPSQMT